MKKIGITGSLASGKTTASKIISERRGPLFSADREVKRLYNKSNFKNLISRKFKIKSSSNIKKEIIGKIIEKKSNIHNLEKIIHPIIRKKMNGFIKENKGKKFIFLEIPLLIESKLMKKFDLILFIKAKKALRLKRFKLKGGNKKLFNILDKKQLSDEKKIAHCDEVVVNEKNLKILKKRLSAILSRYE